MEVMLYRVPETSGYLLKASVKCLPSCIVWFASWRNQEVVVIFEDCCHGNTEIHMLTKFHI